MAPLLLFDDESPDAASAAAPASAEQTLTSILQAHRVHLGGSSFGQGLAKAARCYLQHDSSKSEDSLEEESYLSLQGASALTADALRPDYHPDSHASPEESFYVMDVGVVISQVYQWRKYLPRVNIFYAVKCNPHPLIVKVLYALGCGFDCASRDEIRQVQAACQEVRKHYEGHDLKPPEIIYANPCKAPAHIREAVCRDVRLVTFDNVTEVIKCSKISKHIQLVLRIITDDRGSQCRFSTKFGAARELWRPLLSAAKHHGLEVVGVSFHVGSGCRDATKYQLALQDARELFDLAKREYDFQNMHILDIGGGFPGETHSIWNPSDTIDVMKAEEKSDEGKAISESSAHSASSLADDPAETCQPTRFMCFTEIAQEVAPMIDQLFPDPSIRVIAEPGRYLVAACATLCCSVIAARDRELDTSTTVGTTKNSEESRNSKKTTSKKVNDATAAQALDALSRSQEQDLVEKRGRNGSLDLGSGNLSNVSTINAIQEELSDYTKLYANQQLAQQEFDVYNDKLDLYSEGWETARDLLGPPEDDQLRNVHHTAEGMSVPLVDAAINENNDDSGAPNTTNNNPLVAMAAAGEAAVNGMVLQAVVDSTNAPDDHSYYINDGVYGAFNNLMFDHATVRPRVLKKVPNSYCVTLRSDGLSELAASPQEFDESGQLHASKQDGALFASTVFGPTCDSIDIISRSVLLPHLEVGDYLYFTNMGAYTMAAASSFNGFQPSPTFGVCSVQPDFFGKLIVGPSQD